MTDKPPPSFETATFATLRTLTTWLMVVSVGLVLLIGLGVWGFIRAGDAASTARGVAASGRGTASQAQSAANQARYAAAQARASSRRVASDEHATCKIQKLGLPVQRELRFVVKGIHAVLTDPPTRQQRRQQALAPPSRRVLRDVRALDQHTSRYLQLEARQPRSRNC